MIDFTIDITGNGGLLWINGQKVPMDRNLAALLIIRLRQMYPSIEEVV